MTSVSQATPQPSALPARSEYLAQMNELEHRKGDAWLRVSDLETKVAQLEEQKSAVSGDQKRQFNQSIAEAKHQHTKAMMEYSAIDAQMRRMEQANQISATAALAPGNQPAPAA